jgi:hypothetical protein
LAVILAYKRAFLVLPQYKAKRYEEPVPQTKQEKRTKKDRELHSSLYLVQSHDGKPRQVCIPKSWEDRVRRAVNDYQEMQRLIEEVSELEWKRLRENQKPES